MARGLGINVDRTFAITFALGSGLAGLGGALAIEIVGLDPNFAFTYLVYVLIIVSVGGLGSIAGSLRRRLPDRHQRHRRQILCAAARRLPDLSGHGGRADVAAGRPVREALTHGRYRAAAVHRRPICNRSAAGIRSRSRSGWRRCCPSCCFRIICRWRARSRSPRCSRCRSISSSAMPASSRSATPPSSASAPIPPACSPNSSGASRSPG